MEKTSPSESADPPMEPCRGAVHAGGGPWLSPPTPLPSAPALLAALEAAHAALDSASVRDDLGRQVGWVSAEGMTAEELGRAVRLQARLEDRVAGLRLHTVAAAEAAGAPDVAAATDASAWAASAGRNRSRSWGGAWLANLLERKYAHVRAALARGRISEEHARIIVKAAESADEAVPGGVDATALADCEERMVARAETLSPRGLRRAVRRLLEPLSPQAADAHEGEQLRKEERQAEAETWLVLGDNGDGTFSGRFTIPELHGNLLKSVLEQLTAPRRWHTGSDGVRREDPTLPGFGTMNYTERLGAGFCELIEHLPVDGLARSPITMVVHIDEEKLRSGTGAATLDNGTVVSASEARRLACQGGIMPLVFGKGSHPLDLGHSSRLFSTAQRIALSAIHDSCAAEGCERPFAWCELHHKTPWSQGGRTDLDNAVPLCGHHHRRVHDPRYEHEWLAGGAIRFQHRWPSRRRPDPWKASPPKEPGRTDAA